MTLQLVQMLDLDISYVRSEVVKNLTSIVRVFPGIILTLSLSLSLSIYLSISPYPSEMKHIIVPCLSRCLRQIDDSEARSCVVWMIGEFGEDMLEAPYMLEPLIDNYETEVSASMNIQLLVAAMKLFFKRPPEMQHMLG